MFRDEVDFQFMLSELRELAQREDIALHAYALLPELFYLLATPETGKALSLAMQALGRRYVRHFNRRHGREGTLWQARFRCTVIDPDRFLLHCSLFVEMAPVRADVVADAAAYPWSSLLHHLGQQVDPGISEHAALWRLGNTPFDRQAAYRRLFDGGLTQDCMTAIHNAAERGWALGDPEFIDLLATKTSRRLAPLPVGRPKRLQSAA
jgi:putative transposase